MKRILYWQRVMKALALAMVVGGVTLLVPAGHAQGSPSSQEHQAIQNQLTTHDGNQTSQHSGLTPTWEKTLPANDPGGACPSNSSRFTCVMGGAAVRDNETGLVWEQSPSTIATRWQFGQDQCNNLTVGNRKGWRLPTVQELESLIDPTESYPPLPSGHPFTNVQSGEFYWSATTWASDQSFAWVVYFVRGDVNILVKSPTIPPLPFVWCVRGGQGVDPQ